LSYLYEHPAPTPHWSNYVKGAAYFARLNSGAQGLRGFDFLIDSSIPAGGGASSSSALVVLASAAVRDINELPYEPLELARGAAKAEWYIGTRGGEMDHITMCLAKKDHAVLISYLSQQARHVPIPGRQFRWITFFSHAADKGREVMIEYNERAAVSRIVLPALIEGWKLRQLGRYEKWSAAVRALDTEPTGTIDEIETLLQELPEKMTLTELGQNYPEALAACARSFPILVAERANRPLHIRSRALHHIGEVRRVKSATLILENLFNASDQELEAAMRLLGTLLDQSHASLRDLYDVSTPHVDSLIEIIRTSPGVYGAHLMGGGFGGNVLALVSDKTIDSLIERVQVEYYAPQNRQGVEEGSVMVSTPGEGLASIDVSFVWREAIEEFNSSASDATLFRAPVNAILDNVEVNDQEVWPVIVAAGKGTRSLASGLATPKPLAPVLGKPVILHVLQNLRTAFGETRAPIVIVSPETEEQTRALIAADGTFVDVTFVVQPEALGTGDAVLCAHEQMQGFQGRALVIWSTQPVIRPETMRRALKLSSLFETYQMVFPTAFKDCPYAPLSRDDGGRVQSARETHLEQADPAPFGETNIGMFLLRSEPMFKALNDLHQRYRDKTEGRYLRNRGELGFPNELVNYFATQAHGVLASPIADSREEQGIKKVSDIATCEQFIAELAAQ
jgi:galactokinase/CTP:molybdopterin cytidylyltransferase MocA